jgi:hypothetical protein
MTKILTCDSRFVSTLRPAASRARIFDGAEEVGLISGDVIEQVGDRPDPTLAALTALWRYGDTTPGNLVALLVHGKADMRWVTLFVGRIDVADLVAAPLRSYSPGMARDASAEAPRQ